MTCKYRCIVRVKSLKLCLPAKSYIVKRNYNQNISRSNFQLQLHCSRESERGRRYNLPRQWYNYPPNCATDTSFRSLARKVRGRISYDSLTLLLTQFTKAIKIHFQSLKLNFHHEGCQISNLTDWWPWEYFQQLPFHTFEPQTPYGLFRQDHNWKVTKSVHWSFA